MPASGIPEERKHQRHIMTPKPQSIADATDNTRMQCYWHSLSRQQRIDIYLELFNCDLRGALWGYKGWYDIPLAAELEANKDAPVKDFEAVCKELGV